MIITCNTLRCQMHGRQYRQIVPFPLTQAIDDLNLEHNALFLYFKLALASTAI